MVVDLHASPGMALDLENRAPDFEVLSYMIDYSFGMNTLQQRWRIELGQSYPPSGCHRPATRVNLSLSLL